MLTIVLVLVGALLAGVAVLWSGQRRLIYQPDTSAVPAASALLDDALDVTLTTEDGVALRALYVRAPVPRDPAGCRSTVLVAPGNGGNRAGRLPLARALREAGFDAFALRDGTDAAAVLAGLADFTAGYQSTSLRTPWFRRRADAALTGADGQRACDARGGDITRARTS